MFNILNEYKDWLDYVFLASAWVELNHHFTLIRRALEPLSYRLCSLMDRMSDCGSEDESSILSKAKNFSIKTFRLVG
jgi:hypothetical protein